MKKAILMCFVLACTMAFTSGCKKKGCTDATAENYCEKCKDDGSCTYKGIVQFWYDKTTSDNLVAAGSTSLTFYIDNVVIGSSAANVYDTGKPACTTANVVRSEKDLGTSKTKTGTYKVVDDVGDEIWSGSITYDSSVECTSYQLTY